MREHPTRSWSDVVEHYRRLAAAVPAAAPMRELVERLAASPYAAGLHPLTSMQTLVLAQHERLSATDDEVLVDFDPDRVEFTVRYRNGLLPRSPAHALPPPRDHGWTKRSADGWGALERCFDQLRWFVEYREGARGVSSSRPGV